MERAQVAYAGYMVFFLLLAGSTLLVPLLAFGGDMSGAYDVFAPTCHQKLSRSLCLFRDGGAYWIADCTAQGGDYVGNFSDRKDVEVKSGTATGYKMPICARDFGIYAAMLLAGAAYPFVRRLDSRAMYPAIYLLLAMVPIALDGGLQIFTEIDKPLFGSDIMPFEYESTNAMRLLTGAIAGFAASFYAIPILINVVGTPESRKQDEPAGQIGTARMDAEVRVKRPKARNR